MLRTIAALIIFAISTAYAAEEGCSGSCVSPDGTPPWEFAITAFPTTVRGGDSYTSSIATADRGSLHFEARYNYESVGARSAFVGWTFSGGEQIKWSVTPLLGGAWGVIRAFVPGVEVNVSWGRVDAYIEAEYVRDRKDGNNSYFYSWNELGYRATELFRFGVAGQRTRTHGNGRDIQRGPFAQLTWRRVTIGGYWFNPGSDEQVFVGSLGLAF